MKTRPILWTLLGLVPAISAGAQAWLDRVGDALTWSSAAYEARAQLRGTVDVEGYVFDEAAAGLMQAEQGVLFNPRLSLFVDGQLGAHVYVFAQARVDRGFDPADHEVEARVDEYAVRWTPWEDHPFHLQFGRFATVVGNWAPRHLSWDNPFITAPMVYGRGTGVSGVEVPASTAAFTSHGEADHYGYLPVVWGPAYSTGAAVSGGWERIEGAIALKNAAPSSRPEDWSLTDRGLEHPNVEGRIGYRPSPRWNFGWSGSSGGYLGGEAEAFLPAGWGLGDYRQTLVGQDFSYAWHHCQVWVECYEARFEVPRVGGADTVGWYVEAKYKLTPQLFVAGRWNQQWFGAVPDGKGGSANWGAAAWRSDFAVGYRFTDHLQLKLQYDLQREGGEEPGMASLFAAQFTLRF